jgi:hypothetical protein
VLAEWVYAGLEKTEHEAMSNGDRTRERENESSNEVTKRGRKKGGRLGLYGRRTEGRLNGSRTPPAKSSALQIVRGGAGGSLGYAESISCPPPLADAKKDSASDAGRSHDRDVAEYARQISPDLHSQAIRDRVWRQGDSSATPAATINRVASKGRNSERSPLLARGR